MRHPKLSLAEFDELGPLGQATLLWHRCMPESNFLVWKSGIVKFISIFGPKISVMTAFSGTDVVMKGIGLIESFCYDELGIDELDFTHVATFEKDSQKRTFLQKQFEPGLLGSDFSQARVCANNIHVAVELQPAIPHPVP